VKKGQAWGLAVEVVAVEAGLDDVAQLGRLTLPDEQFRLLSPEVLVPPVGGDREKREAPEIDWIDAYGWVLVRRKRENAAPVSAGEPGEPVRSRRLTSIASYAGIHKELLADSAGFVLPGFEVVPGIRISRECRMSLGAVVAPPVLVCEGARVSYRANLGPSVTIGPGCIVDEEATLVDSIVLPDTYVGRLLAGTGLILDGQLIIRSETGNVAAIADTLLLSDLTQSWLEDRVGRVFARIAGFLLLVVLSPLLALACLSARSPRIVRREVYGSSTRLSVDGTADRVKTVVHEFDTPRLLLRRLGWLWDLAGGRLSFFGNPPLDVDKAPSLEPALRERWLEAPVGVIGLAQVEALESSGPIDPSTEAAAAALYTSTLGSRNRLGLLFRTLVAALGVRS
jgi:hypothetical protein